MIQSEIDQLMTPRGTGSTKAPAMKSRLAPGGVRELGENAQVWAVRIFATLPKSKSARALELVSVCLTNGTELIYLTAADFQTPAPAQDGAYTVDALKSGKTKKRQIYRGISISSFVETLWEKLPGVTRETRLVLVTFGTAENYGPLDLHDLDPRVTYHPAGGQAYALKFLDKKGRQIFRNLEFIDLASYFPAQELEEVAGYYRLSRDVAPPTRPLEDAMQSRAYTVQDAQLTWRIFSSLRRDMLSTWNIDPAVYRTPASCAARVYVSNYLTVAPGPVTKQVRLQAMRCYWGGRIEAFFRGRQKGEVSVYDAVSLYPQACINLQAMPRGEDWYRLTPDLIQTCAGGLCTVEFDFRKYGEDGEMLPDEFQELHPCLPVHAGGKNFYPLSGVSHCTVHEIRFALECGAKITLLEGWAYDLEGADTSLAEYSRDMLARKNAADRGGDYSARTMFKLMVNSLYGKFGQHNLGYSIDTYRMICREYGYPDIPALMKTPNWEAEVLEESGEVIEQELNISNYWYPEWAALINGYARMIESRAMREYVALSGTIDSVIIPGRAGDEFLIQGVTFKREMTGDEFVSIRARLYAVLDAGKIIKVALHGAPQVEGMPEKVAAWQGEEELTVMTARTRQLREGLLHGQIVGKVSGRDKPQTVETRWDERRILMGNYSIPFPSVDGLMDAEQIERAAR